MSSHRINHENSTESRLHVIANADSLDVTASLARLVTQPDPTLRTMIFDRYVVATGPIGPCFVVSSSSGVRNVFLTKEFSDDPVAFVDSYGQRFGRPILRDDAKIDRMEQALREGKRRNVALDLSDLTEFERSVLTKTQEIPFGEVRPYAWVAKEIGSPRAVRAVGSALARNPVPFVVPCHRVVRSDGMIGNYGFGPSSKEAILADEGVPLDGACTLGRERARLVASATTKIVCYPTCRSARRITASHRVAFATLSSAAQAGYRPCQNCRPI